MDITKLASKKQFSGPLLVGIAAFLWATDALVRYPAVNQADPVFIVFVEHLLAILILFPWVYRQSGKQMFQLSIRGWLAALFSGVGGSALAFVFFTASFLFVNPSVAILLQKLQPVLVVVIAYLLLGERPARKFYFLGVVATGAAVVLSFPTLDFSFLSMKTLDMHSKGIQYAFGAAVLWAAATVSGKILLEKVEPTTATFWRFFFGFLGISALMLFSNGLPSHHSHWHWVTNFSILGPILYLSLIPGLLGMLVYYKGLSKTSASVTTFIELVYPIGAVVLNTLILHTPLDTVQTIAAGVLLLAVGMLSF